jgi:hypothetical protein
VGSCSPGRTVCRRIEALSRRVWYVSRNPEAAGVSCSQIPGLYSKHAHWSPLLPPPSSCAQRNVDSGVVAEELVDSGVASEEVVGSGMIRGPPAGPLM